jgi:sporulation protein YlmC with PRC-barrel domain
LGRARKAQKNFGTFSLFDCGGFQRHGQGQAAEKSTPPQPVAGTEPLALGITVDELNLLAKGWSVKKQILGRDVYNDKGQKFGRIDDLIIAPDKAVSYAIIGAGGFLGVDRHDVTIPMHHFKMEKSKIIYTRPAKKAMMSMPQFHYAK